MSSLTYREPGHLTKADTVALWHAVEWMALCLRQPPTQKTEPEALENERLRLKAAKRALRKVNELRKQGL